MRQRHWQQIRILSQRSETIENGSQHGHRKSNLFDQGIHSQNSGGGSHGPTQAEKNVLPASLLNTRGH